MTQVWLRDLRLNAEISGPVSAPPLVLIHGLGLDLHIWDALLAHLPRYRLLRLDLRGHGASDVPSPPYALGTLIRDVEGLLDHFALRDAVLVGAGEGGLIAQGLAVKRMDQVRALVLTGSATRFGNPHWWDARIARHRQEGPDIEADLACILGPKALGTAVAETARTILARTPAEGWQGLASAVGTADLYQTTATLTLPTLVLTGSEDRKTPPDMQRDLADLIVGSDRQLLRGAGHLAMLTHPDAFAAALLAFLVRIGHV